MTSGGVLVRGVVIPIPGLEIVPPASHGGPEWAKLTPGDYCMRPAGTWLRQVIVHTTKGIAPQRIIDGPGAGGRDLTVARFWQGDPEHSAAHIVVDNDGSVVCLADLATIAAYHATVSNLWSVGIEMYQELGGGIHRPVFDAVKVLVPALCNILEIPFQVPADRYAKAPLRRMLNGGLDCAGVFGHRDNTSRRGEGDPGEFFYDAMREVGAESFHISDGEDLNRWSARQDYLNRHHEQVVRSVLNGKLLTVDGLAGRSTLRVARQAGYATNAAIPA